MVKATLQWIYTISLQSVLLGLLCVIQGSPLSAQLNFSAGIGIAERTSAVGVADVDDDGNVDILIAGGTQRWLAGPDFTTEYDLGTSDGGPYAARAADIDGDGDVDWITSDGTRNAGDMPGNIYVYLNPGGTAARNTWTRIVAYTGQVRHQNDMVIIDVDGDGRLDIVEKTWNTPERLVISFQNANINTWTTRAFDTGETGTKTEGVAAGDVDGDGSTDIVQAGFYYVCSNWRTATPVRHEINTRFIQEEMKAVVADFDGDGDQDIYMGSAEGAGQGLYWYENTGANGSGGRTFTEHTLDANGEKAHMTELVDIDFDGDQDIVVGRSFGESGINIFLNDGTGNFTSTVVSATGSFYTGIVADLDDDGDYDMVGPKQFYNASGITYYLQTTPVLPPVAPSGLTATSVTNSIKVDLNWTDNSTDESSFQVERETAGVWTALTSVAANITSYVDSTGTPNTSYRYRVSAANSGGQSSWATSTAITLPEQGGSVTITPGTGNYSTAPTVSISANSPAPEIRYTLDGSEPEATSNLYTTAITIANSATLKAKSFGPTLIPGETATEVYNVAIGGNFPPVANAGPDATYDGLITVTLDANGSTDLDHLNTELTYSWQRTSGPSGNLTNATSAQASFTPSSFGLYTFEVTVEDPTGASSTDQVEIIFQELDPNLVAYWKMNEGSGTTASDERGNHPGTLRSTTGWTPSGLEGSAVNFNTNTSAIDVAAFDVTGSALTLSCWVNPASLNNAEGRFISKASGSNGTAHVWMLSQISNSGIRARLRTSASNTVTLASSTGTLAANTWTFVAMTYDGANLRLYANGSQVGTQALTGTIYADPTVPVTIGNQPPGAGDRAFEGFIDEVKVYDRALSALELQAEFSSFQPPLAGAIFGFRVSLTTNNQAQIEWSSVNEDGVQEYAIDRSVNTIDIDEIGRLPVQATSGQQVNYSFVDASPIAPSSYYRYRRLMTDGQVEVSDWISLNASSVADPFSNRNVLQVWPNPTSGQLSLKPVAYERRFVLRDLLGRTIREVQLPARATQLALGANQPGTYVLSDATTRRSVRVVVE